MVEKQQGQQAGHATVAIREGGDAQEVEHCQRHQHEGIGQVLIQRGGVAHGQIGHSHGCEVRSDWLEAQTRSAIRVTFDDVVIGSLPAPARLRHIAVQQGVELQHYALAEGHVRGRFVDQRQGVTVAGDLLFGAALWCCVADDQRLQPRRRYDNTFQPVRRLSGLHHRDLTQALEGFGRLCGVELLLTPVLAQCAQRGSLSSIESKRGKVLGCERVHGNVSLGCLNGVIIAFK